jgi:hypothetical protein
MRMGVHCFGLWGCTVSALIMCRTAKYLIAHGVCFVLSVCSCGCARPDEYCYIPPMFTVHGNDDEAEYGGHREEDEFELPNMGDNTRSSLQ